MKLVDTPSCRIHKMPQDEPGFFDNFDSYREKLAKRRKNAYADKLARKLLKLMFDKDSDTFAELETQIKENEYPLDVLDDYLTPFQLTAAGVQSWDLCQMLKMKPNALMRLPLWEAFGKHIASCPKGKVPAMAFYNSLLELEMVIHTCVNKSAPAGQFRLVRSSTSGDGGIVIDTLEGFVAQARNL